MCNWTSCKKRLPKSRPGLWSKPVIALTDTGDVFRLSCMGNSWQRSKAFIESGSTEVTHWMPLVDPDAKKVNKNPVLGIDLLYKEMINGR